jgi:MFS family permease
MFASSAPSSSVPIIAYEFHVGREVGNLITTFFLVGFMLGPTFWGPGSELVGRRPIFVGTLGMYTIFHIGQACAKNMTTLLVTRFICGFFAVAPLTNSSGVIADMWDQPSRVRRRMLSDGDKLLGALLCGPARVYMVVWWWVGESAKGWGKENIPGAVAASSVLLSYFLTIMTSFSLPNPILSETLAERSQNIKTALLIFDVKKLTPRIVSRRGKEDNLHRLFRDSFLRLFQVEQ